jgi:hypothetical protein
MGVGGDRHAPAALPPGMTRYPLYRRLGRSQGRSGRVLKILPPPVFDLRTVQLVASRYTDYGIPAVSLFVDLQINPFSPRPRHSANESQSFRFSVKIFLWFALAAGPENIFSPGPEPALGGSDPTNYQITRFCGKIHGARLTECRGVYWMPAEAVGRGDDNYGKKSCEGSR